MFEELQHRLRQPFLFKILSYSSNKTKSLSDEMVTFQICRLYVVRGGQRSPSGETGFTISRAPLSDILTRMRDKLVSGYTFSS